jgi:lipid-A-disaccharide synthase-like uncharacterized protein
MNKLTEVIKWLGFVVLCTSAALNGYNIYPAGPVVGVLGGVIWLIAAIRMRDAPLIATNLVMLTISASSMLLKMYI